MAYNLPEEALRKLLDDGMNEVRVWAMLKPAMSKSEFQKYISDYITSNLATLDGDGQEGKGQWKPIKYAPKDGSTIKVSYEVDGSDSFLVKWLEQLTCAGGRTYGEGWAQTEIPAGEGLPVDEPLMYFAAISVADGEGEKVKQAWDIDKAILKEISEKMTAYEKENKELKEIISKSLPSAVTGGVKWNQQTIKSYSDEVLVQYALEDYRLRINADLSKEVDDEQIGILEKTLEDVKRLLMNFTHTDNQ